MLLTKHVLYYGKKIKVEKLTKNSSKKVRVRCPECGEIRETYYFCYLKSETDMCQSCSVKKANQKFLKIGTIYGRLKVVRHAKESGRSICKCECGEYTVIKNSLLKMGKTKSCGCLRKENFDNVERSKGENHGMWKGGVSGDRERFMKTTKYKEWRTSVFERDKYTCKKCGQKGYELNCHHILPYATHKNTRLDIDNGITFCKSCHIEFHKIYGRKDISGKEIEEYITRR